MVGRLIRNRAAVGTIGLVLIVALIGIFAPFIAPNDPYATDILNKFAGFSQQYPLGTDNLGRCILSRMIYGIRPTLGLAVLTMLGTIGLGALMGLLAGYFRGIVEEVIMRTVDVMTCFDPLYRIGSQMAETFAAHTDWDRAKIREISLEVLEKMRIHNPEEVLGQYPHQLSGGMLQRIMIGLALAMKPALLVADEPTTAIDAITQAEILKEFQRIKEESHTAMIFISHDLGAVSKIADEIVVMNGGKLVEQGDFEHILRHAKDPYTRMLAETRRSVMERYRLCLDNQEELCLN